MKTVLILLLMMFSSSCLPAQKAEKPGVELRDLNGKLIPVSEVITPGQPVIVLFWKSGNSKCCENLETVQSAWLSQLKDKGVNFIAICEDCSGSWSHVKPIVAGKGWEFEVYIDVNGDFKRSLGISIIPSTILYDAQQNIICTHPGWCSGNEELLCEKIISRLENLNDNNQPQH
ncbi:MAG: TlpA family protein disulfide reductase [Lentimicrobium sp.]|nr:TlpA family protein disulfide reductase [Lentimicrobium sp.]